MPVDRESARVIPVPEATLSGSWSGPRAPRAPARPVEPAGEAASLDKQMVKRALFPRRAGPARIGRFTVLAPIGRGGMGVVYACWDDELGRKVAVKVLHGDAVRDPMIARTRLLREAQAMARLSHANIVTVHEVGQEGGRVHVAMEFVRGAPLDAWAKDRPWREVLAAFVQAGRGLAAAHRAGLVHRDFKPQNVLVGDDGIVKVLDFGLARAAGEARADEEAAAELRAGRALSEAPGSALVRSLTRTGQVLGTPLYMSPEQHRGERAGPASDQFSFCVSLYHCLYAAMPFASSSLGALLEDLRRGEPAPPPARSPVPAWIFKALRRGLASDPRRRHATMDDLLAALQRDPAARVRRGGAIALVAAAIGAASFTAARPAEIERCPDARPELAGIWDAARRAEVEATAPAGAFAAVAPALDRHAEAWVQMRGEACRAHAAGRQSAYLFDLRAACLDRRRAGLDALAAALAGTDAAGAERVIAAAAALPAVAGCAEVEALTAAVPPPEDPELRAQVQRHREALARAQVREDAGQFQVGRALVEAVLADAAPQAYPPLRAEALLRRGSLAMEAGDHAAAEAALAASLWTAIAAGDDAVAAQASAKRGYVLAARLGRPAEAAAGVSLTMALGQRVAGEVEAYAELLTNVGVVEAVGGALPAARRRWEEAQALRERHGRTATPRGLDTLANLGWLARAEGRYEDAAVYYARTAALAEELLGADHATALRHGWLLADALFRVGRPRAALARLRAIEARFDRIESPHLRGMVLHTLGVIERAEGDSAAARRHLEAALAAVEAGSEIHAAARCEMIGVAAGAGEAAEVEAWIERAERGLPADPRDRGRRCVALERGRALAALGRADEGAATLGELQAALAGPDDALERAEVTIELARVQRQRGALTAAAAELERALAELQSRLPPQSVAIAAALQALGEVEVELGRRPEAAERLRQALAIYALQAEPEHLPRLRTHFALARALEVTAPAEARAHAEQALAGLQAAGRAAEAGPVAAWLAGRG